MGRTAILVDDGVATGSTMHAAVEAVRKLDPAEIVVAVPVAEPGSLLSLRRVADKVVCLAAPQAFEAVGSFYQDFEQVSDETVYTLLDRASKREEPKLAY